MFCLRSLRNSNISKYWSHNDDRLSFNFSTHLNFSKIDVRPLLSWVYLYYVIFFFNSGLAVASAFNPWGKPFNKFVTDFFFVSSGSNIDTVEFAVIFASSCIFLENAKLSTSSSWRMWMPVNQVCSSEGQEHLLFRRPFKKFKYSALSLPLLKLEM